MTPDWNGEDGEFWDEYNDPKTPWRRKIKILFTMAYRAHAKFEHKNEHDYLESALAIAKEHKLFPEVIELGITLTRVLLNTSDKPLEALDMANQTEALLPEFTVETEELEHKAELAQIKGKTLMALERYDEALHQWRMYTDISETLGKDAGVAYGYEFLALTLVELHELDQAKEYAGLAREIYLANSRPIDVCDVDRILARIMIEKGFPKSAVRALKGIRRAERLINNRSNTDTKLWLGVALANSEQYEQAEKLFRKIIQDSFRTWKTEFKKGLLAAKYLSFMLGEIGRTEERDELWESIREVESRLPNYSFKEDQERRQEISELLSNGYVDAALIAAGEFTVEKSDQGSIQGRWLGIYETLRCHREQNDAEAIVTVWDSVSHASLEYQDEIVIQLKNIVSHALFMCGRIEEALVLNTEVLNDYRAKQDLQEMAYAHENKGSILQAQKKPAKKWFDLAIEENMEAGNIDRALKLSKIRTKNKNSKNNPESYK
jgi:tetratricopeptide (TPR) repeat protein